jgi:uncharacterized membrane protein
MSRQDYLHELEKALRVAHVRDIADILEEYAEHFDLKLQDGYAEEEIAARLAPPEEIVAQLGEIKPAGGGRMGSRLISAIGLFFADVFAVPIFILLYAWVVVLGALTVASAAAGAFAILGIAAISAEGIVLIPDMPYICALLLGISLLALAVLAAFGTEYCRLYVNQIVKVYSRWHRSIWGIGDASPPLPAHPVIKPKKRRTMSRVALAALAVFAVAFVAGLGSMMIAAGSLEPWHFWHWFE